MNFPGRASHSQETTTAGDPTTCEARYRPCPLVLAGPLLSVDSGAVTAIHDLSCLAVSGSLHTQCPPTRPPERSGLVPAIDLVSLHSSTSTPVILTCTFVAFDLVERYSSSG